MPSGILIVDKPADWTSQDVAAKLRGVYRERRVGHGGTLDPMATGVLPVFIGRATRAVSFFESADKEYECALRLGVETDTQDVTGNILTTRDASAVTDEAVQAVLPRFLGPQDQLPPMYSAIKIGEKKLYELARKGQDAPRQPRRIPIHPLTFLGRTEEGDVRLRVGCSKGTYIRTLCADLGDALGCGGCMSALRRTAAGRYTLTQAHTLPEILAAQSPEALLLGVDSLFDGLPALTLTQAQAEKARNGNPVPFGALAEGEYRVYAPDGSFFMVARAAQGMLVTVKSFFEV